MTPLAAEGLVYILYIAYDVSYPLSVRSTDSVIACADLVTSEKNSPKAKYKIRVKICGNKECTCKSLEMQFPDK